MREKIWRSPLIFTFGERAKFDYLHFRGYAKLIQAKFQTLILFVKDFENLGGEWEFYFLYFLFLWTRNGTQLLKI